MADKKILSEKEIAKKIKDLKIELLKNPTKRKSIKREIARLLTMENVKNDKEAIVDDKKDKITPKGVPHSQKASAKADKLGKNKLKEKNK